MRRFMLIGLGLIVGLGILALAGVGAVTVFRRLTDATTSDTPPTQAIYLPDGFAADVYADPDGAELPSVIAFGPDEQLYLMTNTGKLFRLEDQDGDHQAETAVTLFDNSNALLRQSVGLTWDADGMMYISDSGRISTFEDLDGDGKLETLTPIVEGLPSLQFPDHSNNGI